MVETIAARSRPSEITILGDDGPFASLTAAEGEAMIITSLHAHGGVPVLRMRPEPGGAIDPSRSQDHPYQDGVRVAHGSVDGNDLWTTNGLARLEHAALDMPPNGAVVVDARLAWNDAEGRRLVTETRRVTFASFEDVRFVDLDVRFEATGEGVVFGDVKDGLVALRLADELAPARNERVRCFDSEGREGASVWGEEARWVAHAGELPARDSADDAPAVTVVLLSHPENHLAPERWHVRPYGIVAANPFGLSAFTGAREDLGSFRLDPYTTLDLRYRIALADRILGPEEVDELWNEFAGVEPAADDAADPGDATP